MKEYPIIYKRTATGAIQQWQQEVEGGKYRTISGQVDGKLVTTDWVTCEGTNIGRANERTPEQQAVFEVEANYKLKLDKEYHKSIDTIDEVKVFLPMLAKDYKDHKHKLDFEKGVFVQPKLDGMRCIATAHGLFSRNGKPILSVPHIWEALEAYFEDSPYLVLDGELYNHEYKDDFNAIISAAKKTKPSAKDLEESAALIQYHVYDIPSYEGTFAERAGTLAALEDEYRWLNGDSLRLVETHYCADEEAIDAAYGKFLERGYEGLMVRADAPYVNKRTDALLKRKEFIDKEFICTDIEPGNGDWAGKAKRAFFQLPGLDVTFKATPTGTMEFCEDLLKNKHLYIGQPATVRYFALTPDGVPRFGRVKEWNRNDNVPAVPEDVACLIG